MRYQLIIITIFVLPLFSLNAQVEDTTPPELVALDFAPETIDVSTGPQDVTFTLRISDDLSGFNEGTFWVHSPSRQQYQYVRMSQWNLISGDDKDGIYKATVTFSQYSESGTWHIDYSSMEDNVRNYIALYENDLITMGFPTELVIEAPGPTPPQLEYEWIYPDSPEALMGRNYIVKLEIHNPADEAQTSSFSFSQEVFSTHGTFGWDEGWQETILFDGTPYTEGSLINTQVHGLTSVSHYFTINNKWNWIYPYVLSERLINIVAQILLSFPGFETASLTYTTITSLFIFVQHVAEVSYLCTGIGDSESYQTYINFSVPYEKYLLYGESVLAGIGGSKLTCAGIAALYLGLDVANKLFALGAIAIAYGEEAYVLAVDPDPNYKDVTNPELIAIPEIGALEDGLGKQAALTLLDALSYIRAAAASYTKYEVAEDMGDLTWMTIQLKLTNTYLEKASNYLNQTSLLLQPIISAIPDPTNVDIDKMRDRLKTNGLPQIEVEILLALGYSNDEIEAISQATADLPNNAFTLFPNLPQVFSNIAQGLNNAIEAMPSTPDEVVTCTIDFDPDTLNLKSQGNWITCYIELPMEYYVGSIDVNCQEAYSFTQ